MAINPDIFKNYVHVYPSILPNSVDFKLADKFAALLQPKFLAIIAILESHIPNKRLLFTSASVKCRKALWLERVKQCGLIANGRSQA